MVFVSRTLPTLLLCFLLSLIIRIPTLNRPLSKHHEFCTAVSLRILQIWYEGGIANYDYNPAMNYKGTTNKHINNFASGSGQMEDKAGNFYYTSHPPLGYYLPYSIFSLLHKYPTIKGLQYINLCIHFVCSLFIYWIVCLLTGKHLFGRLVFAGLTGFVLYLFNPCTLWFQSNVYMADMFVQLPFVIGLLLFLLTEKGNLYVLWIFPLLATVFAMIYSSWLGVFFAIILAGYYMFHARKKPIKSLWALSVVLAALGALWLTGWQYSHINGWSAYIAEAGQRFAERGPLHLSALPVAYFTILKNYLFNYLPLLLLIALLMYLNGNKTIKKLSTIVLFIIMAGLPLVLLHLVLTNYSGHDFTTLYAAPLLSIVAAMLLYRDQTELATNQRPLLALMVVVSCLQFYYINRPGEQSLNGDRYDTEMAAGLVITSNTDTSQVAFLMNDKPTPQQVLYAHKNIEPIKSEEDAMVFMNKYGLTKGVIFTTSIEGQLEVSKKLSLPSIVNQ